MKIITNVAPSARGWARNKAAQLARLTPEEFQNLQYEEASGYDRATAIGIIISAEAPMTDEELYNGSYYQWDYEFEVEG